MNTWIWMIQALLALVFLAHGLLFLLPPEAIRKVKKQSPLPAALFDFVSAAEILAAFGLILPGLTDILPWLTPLAAAGLVPIMAGATLSHVARRETAAAIFTATLLALAVFVAVARWFVVPL